MPRPETRELTKKVILIAFLFTWLVTLVFFTVNGAFWLGCIIAAVVAGFIAIFITLEALLLDFL